MALDGGQDQPDQPFVVDPPFGDQEMARKTVQFTDSEET